MINPEKYPPLNLPIFDVKIRKHDDEVQIFDIVRRKYLKLTPEEWVRQHFVNFLIQEKKVPASLIKLEYQIRYGKLKKRPDIAIIHPKGHVWLIVECKAPKIPISKNVFDQAVIYFSVEKPELIALANGLDLVSCSFKPKDGNFVFIKELPNFKLE